MISSLKKGILFSAACAALSLVASCAGTSDVYTPEAEESFVSRAMSDWVSPDAEKRESWQQYQFALQAMEDEDWLVARHHLDLALKKLVEENYDSLYSPFARPQDSLYRRDMPKKIIAALDEVYPGILEMGEDASTYVRYEFEGAGLDNLDEPPLDSAERVEIESFLDTLNRAEFTLPVEFNDRVMQEILYMTTRAHDFTEASLSRKTAFEEMIYAKIDSMGMPRDLIYLALVESGYKIKAYSRAKAAGLWQFIPATGKRYGLHQDFWVDMRRNPELSTTAALRYLQRLKDEFGDWLMAMAAYNCGEGCVRRRIRDVKADTLRDSTRAVTYWDLELPKETMHYVPRILAAMTIGHYPEHYGMTVEKRERMPFDTVTVVEFMPLEMAAQAAGVDTKTIQELNLELSRWCTPDRGKPGKDFPDVWRFRKGHPVGEPFEEYPDSARADSFDSAAGERLFAEGEKSFRENGDRKGGQAFRAKVQGSRRGQPEFYRAQVRRFRFKSQDVERSRRLGEHQGWGLSLRSVAR